MKKRIQARLDMNYAVLLTLAKYAATISKIPALETLVEELKVNVQKMEDGMALLAGNKEGVTDNKKITRLELAAQAGIYGGILKSYAADKKLHELKKKIGVGPSLLRAMGAGKLINYSHLVLQEMKLNLAALAVYNVSVTDVNEFEAQIGGLVDATAAPKQVTASHNAAKEKLSELARENNLLHKEKMAPLVLKFRKTDPDFLAEYKVVRKIRSPYTSHTRVQGVVTDNNTGNPVGEVVVKVEGAAYFAVSTRNGSYRLYIPAKGAYTVTFEKAGYTTYRQKDVTVTTGEATSVDASLTPVA